MCKIVWLNGCIKEFKKCIIYIYKNIIFTINLWLCVVTHSAVKYLVLHIHVISSNSQSVIEFIIVCVYFLACGFICHIFIYLVSDISRAKHAHYVQVFSPTEFWLSLLNHIQDCLWWRTMWTTAYGTNDCLWWRTMWITAYGTNILMVKLWLKSALKILVTVKP